MNANATFPSNDLEECLKLASETGDDAKLLRALARNVVCFAQPGPGPPPGEPAIRTYAPGQRPLPVVEGKDGRPFVLAFSSFAQLALWYPDPLVVWTMMPMGVLARDWPAESPLLLNAGGTCAVLLEPEDIETVALLFADANVPEAFQVGPATSVGFVLPEEEPPELFDPLRRVAARHPEMIGVRWALAKLNEPEARIWPIIGVIFAEGAEYRGALEDAVTEGAAETDVFVELRLLDPRSPGDAISEWLLANGRPLELASENAVSGSPGERT